MGILTHQLEGAIAGYDLELLTKGVLVTGPGFADVAARLVRDGGHLIEQGLLTLRLGVLLYAEPYLFIPQSIVDEAGQIFAGEVVFDWFGTSAYSMPRAQVFGTNAVGKDDMIFARDVDVESSPIVVGGPDASPVYVALVYGQASFPPRFSKALRSLSAEQLPEVPQRIASA
jgi:hypothetical protein